MPGPVTRDRLPSLRPMRRGLLAGGAAGAVIVLGVAGVLFLLDAGGTSPLEWVGPAVAPPAAAPDEPLRRPAPPSAGQRPGQPRMAGPGWRVISVSSVTDVLLVIVETERLDDIEAIASDVVSPAAADHLEALVYFHRPGAAEATARVQWTPRGGYVPLRFAEQESAL